MTGLLPLPGRVTAEHDDAQEPGPGQRKRQPPTKRRAEARVHQHGWDAEYDRDVWRLRALGIKSPVAHVLFDLITQPWLKGLAKRWARWRLTTGLGAVSVASGTRAISYFGRFLASPTVHVDSLDQIDRPLLERYLAYLHADYAGRVAHANYIGQLNLFFLAIRQHGWDDTLPAGAMFFPEDFPPRTERLPRALSEVVMTQLELPANLDRWRDPCHRLITMILMRCGLRITDTVRLPHDCIVRDGDGAPYLRYLNHKMKREALVPIDEQLEHQIQDHQQHLRDRWPQGTPVLFPRPLNNPDGREPALGDVYRRALHKWLVACNVRDEHGGPVSVTPHRFRHTLGTRLINRDVPQEIVRRILDHDSHCMTAHYRSPERYDNPPALGAGPQGQHHRRDSLARPGRPAGRGCLGQATPRTHHPGAAQRLLRTAGTEDVPARQCLPELPDVRHYRRVSAPASAAPRAAAADRFRGRGPQPAPFGRDEPPGPRQPRSDHHIVGIGSGANRPGPADQCELTTPATSSKQPANGASTPVPRPSRLCVSSTPPAPR